MSISQIKTLAWLLAALLGAGLGWSVWNGFERRANFDQLTEQEQLDVLHSVKDPPPPRDELVNYERIKSSFHALNWTGKEAPKPVAADAGPKEPQAAPVEAVASLLLVKFVQVDRADPKGSLALVYYTKPGLTRQGKNSPQPSRLDDLRVEERLPKPYEHVRVSAITSEGVVFAFDDAARELETVPVSEYAITGYIVQVGDGQAVVPAAKGLIARSDDYVVFTPAQTTLIGSNRYRLGTEDVAVVGEDYARILSEEVRYARHRDSRTGAYDGIEVKEVKPGSMAAKHGLSSGDVIKSINGNPVSSVQDAINFVKTNSETTTTWIVVIENKGQERTVTYESPSD